MKIVDGRGIENFITFNDLKIGDVFYMPEDDGCFLAINGLPILFMRIERPENDDFNAIALSSCSLYYIKDSTKVGVVDAELRVLGI